MHGAAACSGTVQPSPLVAVSHAYAPGRQGRHDHPGPRRPALPSLPPLVLGCCSRSIPGAERATRPRRHARGSLPPPPPAGSDRAAPGALRVCREACPGATPSHRAWAPRPATAAAMASRCGFENSNDVGVFANLTNAYCITALGAAENFYCEHRLVVHRNLHA